jgi:hypothetical protein
MTPHLFFTRLPFRHLWSIRYSTNHTYSTRLPPSCTLTYFSSDNTTKALSRQTMPGLYTRTSTLHKYRQLRRHLGRSWIILDSAVKPFFSILTFKQFILKIFPNLVPPDEGSQTSRNVDIFENVTFDLHKPKFHCFKNSGVSTNFFDSFFRTNQMA